MSQFRPARADHAGDAEDFALAGLEAHALDARADDNVLCVDGDFADLARLRLWRIDVGEIASDHHRDKLVAIDRVDRDGADQLAVLQAP